MDTVLLGMRYLCSLVFGITLSAAFCGVEPSRRNVIALAAFTVLDFCLQAAIALNISFSMAEMAYPLITHAPLVVILVAIFKRQWLPSIAAVLLSYLCCELPNILEGLCREVLAPGLLVETSAYVLAAAVAAVLIIRFAARPISKLTNISATMCLSLASVPLLFYLWDYIAGVYTSWMIVNSYEALLAVSGMFAMLFVVFAALYGQVLTCRAEEGRERDKTTTAAGQKASGS